MRTGAVIDKNTGEVIRVVNLSEAKEPVETIVRETPPETEVGDTFIDGQLTKRTLPYYEARLREYPPMGDQLDALMKWLATETEFGIPAELKSIAMTCMSVKAKHPKPEA